MWNGGEILGLLMLVVFITTVIVRRRRSSSCEEGGFPPGPPGWPVIGHLHLFTHEALTATAKTYGPIQGFRLGLQRAVAISTRELAKEVFSTHDKVFSCRAPFAFTSLMFFGARTGIIFSHGSDWRMHRKVTTLQLFTTKRLQELQYVRQLELRSALLAIHHHSQGGTAVVNLSLHIGQMIACLIMRLLHSSPSTSQVCGENLYLLTKEQESEMVPTFGELNPYLSWLDIFRKLRMHSLHRRINKVYSELLMRRTTSNSLYDDLFNALLSKKDQLTALEIKSIVHELLGAGIHPTSLTVEWAMAELLRNPDCLRKLQKEIDMHVDERKEVTEEDLPKLSYLKCVMKESARLHPVIPLLPRMAVEDCKLSGYTIPAKTLLFVNLWAIGRDEKVWSNANEFIPERFEGSDIDLRGHHFELMPFGSGRRSCIAIPMAAPFVELAIANLAKCFNWEYPPGQTCKSIDMDIRMSLTANKANPLMVIPKPRVSVADLEAFSIQEAGVSCASQEE